MIEPIEGTLVTHENPIGVFTNSPNFDWHMTNLRNYINLKVEDVNPVKLDGVVLAPLGQGSGSARIARRTPPIPPSRFVRATLYLHRCPPLR